MVPGSSPIYYMRWKFFSTLVWIGFLLFIVKINASQYILMYIHQHIYWCIIMSYSKYKPLFWYSAIFPIKWLPPSVHSLVMSQIMPSKLSSLLCTPKHVIFLIFCILMSNINIILYLITKAIGVILASFSFNLTFPELLNCKTTLTITIYTFYLFPLPLL